MMQEKSSDRERQTHTNDENVLLQCERLAFAYENGEQPAIRNISFALYERDAMLVLGPSGSGKSTLAYCLSGLYPDAVDGILQGKLHWRGQELRQWDRAALSKQIGIVFQDPESQFVMSVVEDEIAFGLENILCPADEIDSKIGQVLELTGLAACRHMRISRLSGGMKQRLALACVLALEPDFILLDEPTSQLDPSAAREFVQLLSDIRKRRPLSLLIIEHRVDEWVGIANRALVLNGQGEMLFQGGLRECMARHMSRLEQEGIVIPTYAKLGKRWSESGIYLSPLFPVTVDELLKGISSLEAALLDLHNLSLQHVPHEAYALAAASEHTGHEERRSSEETALLALRGLAYSRHGTAILHPMELSLHTGEFVAVAGPNGAGKTTFAHLLAGLIQDHTGAVDLMGRPISAWEERELRKQIGLVFQNPEHQFITATAADEIAFGLRMQGEPEQRIQLRVRDLLELFRLQKHAHANPFSLSQGQKRRLSVAAMLVDEQKMLILDEPTFGQDAHTAHQLMQLLVQFKRRQKCIVMITHDMELVHDYADRVIVLMDGQIQFDGMPDTLWQNQALLQKANLLLPVRLELAGQLHGMLPSGALEGAGSP